MASKPIKMPDLPNMHHGSKEVFKIDHASANTTNNSKSHDRKMNHDLERSRMDNACANSANNLESHGRKMNHDLEKSQMGDACANSTNNSESHDTKINYSLEEAEKMDHASANSGNNSEIHGKMANQTTIDASTTDSASSASGQKDEASQINAKMKTSKPTSKPPNIANHTRNISDPTAGTTKGFPVNTKNTNQGKRSGSSSRSDSLESISSVHIKPHTGGDVRWDAINMVSRGNGLNLSHFRLLKRVGYGDIGSVYLVELKESKAFFAMKVMDKASLASRNKLLRAQTEREILGILDHPFLPTLYSYFETEKYYCLIMEFCSCGSLHSLRLKQPNKHFTEEATRFYCSEILLALEYLHMLGIVYRDLKPENVLVRDEGHIMLSDFDLSLRCSVNPTLVKSSSAHVSSNGSSGGILDNEQTVLQACKQPSSFFPRILPSKKNRKSKSDFGLMVGGRLPELMAEPTNVRSMSFVGTHEYLAPEIIRGEGHGSAVDWWTFGIFLYELLHGTTPFKGAGNKATLYNVVGQPLKFPDKPRVSNVARDLIKGLLVKEPQKRFAYNRGATEIKQHPFFEGVNWALVRSATPPIIPERLDFSKFSNKENVAKVDKKIADIVASDHSSHTQPDSSCEDFEYF